MEKVKRERLKDIKTNLKSLLFDRRKLSKKTKDAEQTTRISRRTINYKRRRTEDRFERKKDKSFAVTMSEGEL